MARAVYPRVCGGTDVYDRWGEDRGGLSPRVRGNLYASVKNGIDLRSIPACAGEPSF